MNKSEMNRKWPKKCPQCGGSLPSSALDGLCPACLLQQGAMAETGAPSEAAPFQPPTVDEVARLFPQLEVLAFIGKGGMGAVYKARQPALDRFVALKILPAQAARGPAFAERFNREARALARLNHPNIVALHEFGQVRSRRREEADQVKSKTGPPPYVGGYEDEAGGLPFFIMEYVDGLNLRQLEQAGKLSPREALEIVPQICQALQFAHDEGIVHRDIKPENILLDKKGRVKIADFGIAKIITGTGPGAPLTPSLSPSAGERVVERSGERQNLTEQHAIGTPHYMAPEQIAKPETVDHRADIYSLGVVFYEMLTGELPLGKFGPPSRKVQVDVRLDEVVLRALEHKPEFRYQQASHVQTAVEAIVTTPAAGEALKTEGMESSPASAGIGTWSPFQSPVVREICAHFTKGERTRAALGGILNGVWVALAIFLSAALIFFTSGPGSWVIASAIVLLYIVCIPAWMRIQRQSLGSTAWARARGLRPEQIKLFSFGSDSLWEGVAVLIGTILIIALAVHELTRLYIDPPGLHRQFPENAAALRQAERSLQNLPPSVSGPLATNFVALNVEPRIDKPRGGEEVARLKLQLAERELMEIEKKFEVGVATKAEHDTAKLARDIAVADLKGDPLERARLKVQIAEINLKVAKAKYENGKAGFDEYNKAKFEHDIAVAEMNQNATETARLKFQFAEDELRVAEIKLQVGAVTTAEYDAVKFARDIASAELKGDQLEAARLKVQIAEIELNVVKAKLESGKATETDVTKAKLKLENATEEAKYYRLKESLKDK